MGLVHQENYVKHLAFGRFFLFFFQNTTSVDIEAHIYVHVLSPSMKMRTYVLSP